jgi:hypothetical protein
MGQSSSHRLTYAALFMADHSLMVLASSRAANDSFHAVVSLGDISLREPGFLV